MVWSPQMGNRSDIQNTLGTKSDIQATLGDVSAQQQPTSDRSYGPGPNSSPAQYLSGGPGIGANAAPPNINPASFGGGGAGISSSPSMPAMPAGSPTFMKKGGPVISPIANKGYRKLA